MIRVAVVIWLAVMLAPTWQAVGVLIPGLVTAPVRDHDWFMANDPSYRHFYQSTAVDAATPLKQNPS